MLGLHSVSKNEREAVRDLVHNIVVRDMSTFNPETFQAWVKHFDDRFRKVALTMRVELNNRAVNVVVKELRTGRTLVRFACSTRVRFDDGEVSLAQAPEMPVFR
jgi:hypothetical protein